MATTKKILTSIHGKRVGLSETDRLIVKGKTVPAMNDAGVLAVLQGAPGALNATGTLTAALIGTGIVTSTSAAGVTATLNTGELMDDAFAKEIEIGEAFDWSVINTGPNTFTVTAAASGHTVVGAGAVATTTSGLFRTRRTAVDTWVTYRLS
jgi:hypothetical protein